MIVRKVCRLRAIVFDAARLGPLARRSHVAPSLHNHSHAEWYKVDLTHCPV